MTSHGTPNSVPLPMKAKGSSGLNTVVSSPRRRATPRTAVSDPNVTMNGGRLASAISAPLRSPKPRPTASAAGTPSMPQSGISEPRIATIAEAARIEPTERSMPPVRMTKVIPAASTTLIEACWATIDRFCQLMKRPLISSKAIADDDQHRQHAEHLDHLAHRATPRLLQRRRLRSVARAPAAHLRHPRPLLRPSPFAGVLSIWCVPRRRLRPPAARPPRSPPP